MQYRAYFLPIVSPSSAFVPTGFILAGLALFRVSGILLLTPRLVLLALSFSTGPFTFVATPCLFSLYKSELTICTYVAYFDFFQFVYVTSCLEFTWIFLCVCFGC